MRSLHSILLLLIPVTLAHRKETPHSVEQAFVQAGLVPDVLSSFHPVLLLDTSYSINGTGETKVVSPPGRNFTRPETLNRPTWSIPSNDHRLAKETFVIAMVDPDAPTPQNHTSAQIRHFLGGGFKLAGPPSAEGCGTPLVNTTPALSEYRQPTPPNISDPHRYTFLLYRQPIDFPTSISSPISKFNISAFAEEFGLGAPLAGNFLTVSTKVPV